jgi:outer membrane biosynthesis protein TonB
MGIYDEEVPSVFHKYRVLIVCGILTAIAIAVWFAKGRFEIARASQERKMVMVDLPPPPSAVPPPPPSQLPPPPPMETEQRMVTQDPVAEAESKPDDTPAGPAPAVATALEGTGADGFGLRVGKTIFNPGSGKTESNNSNSRWGWYASQVQSVISQALQNNKDTRYADFRVEARIWADPTGKITRARIAKSTGNAAVDNALTNAVLTGLILQEAPPAGMPMPIVLRLTARPSNMAISR